jgi:hypothetical protein
MKSPQKLSQKQWQLIKYSSFYLQGYSKNKVERVEPRDRHNKNKCNTSIYIYLYNIHV